MSLREHSEHGWSPSHLRRLRLQWSHARDTRDRAASSPVGILRAAVGILRSDSYCHCYYGINFQLLVGLVDSACALNRSHSDTDRVVQYTTSMKSVLAILATAALACESMALQRPRAAISRANGFAAVRGLERTVELCCAASRSRCTAPPGTKMRLLSCREQASAGGGGGCTACGFALVCAQRTGRDLDAQPRTMDVWQLID
jgi:hypothetical protein